MGQIFYSASINEKKQNLFILYFDKFINYLKCIYLENKNHYLFQTFLHLAKCMDFGLRTVVQASVLHCLTLDKFLKHSKPQLPHCKTGRKAVITTKGCRKWVGVRSA